MLQRPSCHWNGADAREYVTEARDATQVQIRELMALTGESIVSTTPPTIWVLGVAHYDVRGRPRLMTALKSLNQRATERPAFVAVEYSTEEMEARVAARPRVRARLAEQWSDLSGDELDALAATYGYEGDTHREVFPGVETLSLDEARAYPADPTPEEYMVSLVCGLLWHLPETHDAARAAGASERQIEAARFSGMAGL